MEPEITEIAKVAIREQSSGNPYVIHIYKETENYETPVETLVIELLDTAGRSLSILRLHVDIGDLRYGPYPGKDEDKLYLHEREIYRALGKLAEEKLIQDIRIPAEERDQQK